MKSSPASERDKIELSAVERRRIISIKEAARLRGVHPDTLRRESQRTGKPRIVRISARRVGCILGEVLGEDA